MQEGREKRLFGNGSEHTVIVMKHSSVQTQRSKDAKKAEGYLTVFLALALPIILSLIFTLLDGARRNAVRMQTEFAADIAVNSALSEFSQELFLQYDLLMIDTAYGDGKGELSRTEEHVRQYMDKNLSSGGIQTYAGADFTRTSIRELTLTDTRFALDDGCGVLREQVNAYLSAEPIEGALSRILKNVNSYNGLGLDLTEWSRKKAENEESLRSAMEEARKRREQARSSGEEAITDEGAAEAEAYAAENGIDLEHAMNPWKEINNMRSTPILSLVLNDVSVSSRSANTTELLSHRSWNQGSGSEPQNSHHYSQADALYMNQYISEKCGNYRNLLEKGQLGYQIEYLLFGQSSDRSNLEKMAETLLLIRLAANTAYILSNSEKRSEAGVWGNVLSLLCLMPELGELFTMAILLAWSYVESVNDVKILFSGGKVPLMKSGSDWNTRLLSIFCPSLSGGNDSNGLDYEEYLRILLMLENGNTRDYRLMDIMEMDVRKAEGGSSFRMDCCLDTFTMQAVVSSSFGYSYSIRREGTYE